MNRPTRSAEIHYRMTSYSPSLDWLDTQHQRMCALVEQWAAINSGTHNPAGLEKMTRLLLDAFSSLGGDTELLDAASLESVGSDGQIHQQPLAKVIHIIKRPDAPRRVFLGIHMDTVYPADHPFQSTQHVDANTLRGPGVADAKGGLAVMLLALEALERSSATDTLGWEVLINADEEIGSPGSAHLLADAAKRCHLGLVFEPTLADGTLAGARGGAGRFTLVFKGKPAHVGRQFHDGRSAIDAMASTITALSLLNGSVPGAIVNVGHVEGGGPINVVPDLAICRINVRATNQDAQNAVQQHLQQVLTDARRHDGITVQMHGQWTSPPKPMDHATQTLFQHVAVCGRDLGLSIKCNDTAGVCDGNKLAAAGLPTVDTLGPRGGGIHSTQEFVLLDSLTERAKLSALLMLKLATGQIDWPNK